MSFGTGKIWMNGSLLDWDEAKIHIGSHLVHYGSGVFEGARCYETPNGSVCFRLDDHLRRLYDSAKIYRMEYHLGRQQFQDSVLETIRANAYTACYIRPLIYRGYNTLGVDPLNCPVDAAILVWEWGKYLGEEALEKGVDVLVSSWVRAAPNTLPALSKSTANYANAQLIKMEAVLGGFSEGIALDTMGHVSEGSGAERVLGARRGPLYATVGLIDPPGDHPGRGHHPRARPGGCACARSRCHARCSTSPTRSSSRARPRRFPDPVHRPDHDRPRQPRARDPGDSTEVLRHHQWGAARPAWLADPCVSQGDRGA